MHARTRSRTAVSIGANQSGKSGPASSASGCTASRFVVGLVMAWSPARRANAGIDRVGQPGDYATPDSNQPRDATRAACFLVSWRVLSRATGMWATLSTTSTLWEELLPQRG